MRGADEERLPCADPDLVHVRGRHRERRDGRHFLVIEDRPPAHAAVHGLEEPSRSRAGIQDEWIPGLTAIAAPVFAGGRMVAALAAATSSARWEAIQSFEIASRVRGGARRIGERMEGRQT